jgi:hypothetical protein
MQVTILDTQIGKHGQNVIFSQILDARLPARTVGKLQITIRTDPTKSQAYARIEKYDGNQWQPLAQLLKLETDYELAYWTTPHTCDDFELDRSRLIEIATKILEC